MKVVRAEKIESVDDYRIIDTDMPTPAPDEVLIKVAACGMGYVDALVALGGYQVKPPVPFTPGQEIAGTIAAVGAEASGVSVGDRVMANSFGGGLAEFVIAKRDSVVGIPDAMTFPQAAGFRINYITALHSLEDRGAVQPGERLVVIGAAGGVGSAAIQVGRLLGADVVGVASSEAKRSFAAELGATTTIDTDADGWRDRLKAACGGKGPDIVFDPVAGPLFEAAFRSLAWRGRHLVIGFAGGSIPKLPINLTLLKGASLVGVDVRQFLLYEGARAAEHLKRLLAWVAEGALVPPVGREFAFTDFADAMRFARSGQGMAKTVISLE